MSVLATSVILQHSQNNWRKNKIHISELVGFKKMHILLIQVCFYNILSSRLSAVLFFLLWQKMGKESWSFKFIALH